MFSLIEAPASSRAVFLDGQVGGFGCDGNDQAHGGSPFP